MADEIVIRGGTVVDGTGAPARVGRRRDRRRRDRRRRRGPRGRRGRSTPPAASSHPASSTSTPTTTRRCSGIPRCRRRAGTASRRWSPATAASRSRRRAPEHRARDRAHAAGGRGHVGADARRPASAGTSRRSPSTSARSSAAAPSSTSAATSATAPCGCSSWATRATSARPAPRRSSACAVVVADAMRAGALGFASSFSANHRGDRGLPVPSRNGTTEEFVRIASVLGELGTGVVCYAPGRAGLVRRQLRDPAAHRPPADVDADARELPGEGPPQ